MKIWKVGDKATTDGCECTVMAISKHTAAIQYSETLDIEIVCFHELRPNFSLDDEKAIKDIFRIISDEQDYRLAAESLYLEGYRKQEDIPEDTTDPANWVVGDWVICTNKDCYCITKGNPYQIKFINECGEIRVEDDYGDDDYYLPEDFGFFSRGDEK